MGQVEGERPRIFGVLLDVISHGLRRAPDIRPNKLPRMADFAKWAMACETALWRAGTFQKAYDANQGEAVEVLIEGDQVATAIKKLMSTRIEWEGTATALIPNPIDQNSCAHWRNPMDMMRQG